MFFIMFLDCRDGEGSRLLHCDKSEESANSKQVEVSHNSKAAASNSNSTHTRRHTHCACHTASQHQSVPLLYRDRVCLYLLTAHCVSLCSEQLSAQLRYIVLLFPIAEPTLKHLQQHLTPTHEYLEWIQFIHFQTSCAGSTMALLATCNQGEAVGWNHVIMG